MTNMLPVADVEIDTAAIIPCPAKGFKPRRAHIACPGCEDFKGIAQMSREGSWHKQYVIRCAHIIERRTQCIEVIEE